MQKISWFIRRKILLPIITLAAIALGAFAFAACADQLTEQDLIDRGFVVAITYDYQGGKADSFYKRTIRVKENSLLPEPSATGGVKAPTYVGHSIEGYYVAEMDENGNPVVEDGKVKPSNRKWNFATDKVADKSITLCVKWWQNYKIDLRYGEDYAESKIIDIPRTVTGESTPQFASAFSVNGYTFLSYNYIRSGGADSQVVIPSDGIVINRTRFDASEDKHTVTVFGESLTGSYTVIRQASDFTLGSAGEYTNYYLMNDIDMGGKEYSDAGKAHLPKVYNGIFCGNGHTISNFSMKINPVDFLDNKLGLFRSLGSNAVVRDVTFKNVSFELYLSNTSINNYYIGMLAGYMSYGAIAENVRIENCTYLRKLEVCLDSESITSEDFLLGSKEAGATFRNITYSGISKTESEAVATSDKKYLIYVICTRNGGVAEIKEVYGLAELSESGIYESRTVDIEMVGDGKYIMSTTDTINEKTIFIFYSVSITIYDEGISAIVVRTEQLI